MNKKRFGLLNLFSFLLCLFMAIAIKDTVKAGAAEADILFMTDDCMVSVGDIVNVDMSIIADEPIGDFEGYLLYSGELLEFVSGPDMVMGGEGVLRIKDTAFASEGNIRTYHLEFKAIDIGTAELSMRAYPSVYGFDNVDTMDVICNRLKLVINAAGTASSNARLSSLKVSPGQLIPAFNEEITAYVVEVPAGTERLVVSAASADEKAEVYVSGNQKLVDGENRVFVRIKAEDGKENEYVIYCNREKAVSEEDENTTPEPSTTPVEQENDEKNTKSDEGSSDDIVDDAEKDDDGSALPSDTVQPEKEKESDRSRLIYILIICILVCMLLIMIIINFNLKKNQEELSNDNRSKNNSGNGSTSGKSKNNSGTGSSAKTKNRAGSGLCRK